MSKHTAGPWVIESATLRSGRKYRNIRGIADTMVANSVSNWVETASDEEESLANATLIAAAPELLKELERMVIESEFWKSIGVNFNLDYIETAKAAIAKAKGEQA